MSPKIAVVMLAGLLAGCNTGPMDPAVFSALVANYSRPQTPMPQQYYPSYQMQSVRVQTTCQTILNITYCN